MKNVKYLLLPLVAVSLLKLIFTPPTGESWGRGLNLVVELFLTWGAVWLVTLFPLTEILRHYWRGRDLRATWEDRRFWILATLLGIVYPGVAVLVLRCKMLWLQP
ncbi:MAG: hypothetical protein FDZ69_07855 [Deltaproteobacteria bacterium]|nr:MAG: hypothetical protein FDZ69_07855 [Deltaproteobacteria bacterium]